MAIYFDWTYRGLLIRIEENIARNKSENKDKTSPLLSTSYNMNIFSLLGNIHLLIELGSEALQRQITGQAKEEKKNIFFLNKHFP